MISIKTTIAAATKALNKFVALFPGGTLKVLELTAQRIQKRMNVEGEPITYPVQWDSEKQRRAFFATDGFGKGIPYQRTGASAQAWQVRTFGDGVELSADHPAGAVSGYPPANFWQSRIHRGRWPWLKPVLYEEIAKIPADIIDKLKVIFGESRSQ